MLYSHRCAIIFAISGRSCLALYMHKHYWKFQYFLTRVSAKKSIVVCELSTYKQEEHLTESPPYLHLDCCSHLYQMGPTGARWKSYQEMVQRRNLYLQICRFQCVITGICWLSLKRGRNGQISVLFLVLFVAWFISIVSLYGSKLKLFLKCGLMLYVNYP